MPVPTDLQPFVTDELKADPIAWPILERMSEKDAPAVLKAYAHAQHRLGSTIPLPKTAEEMPTWRTAHLPKLYQAGVLAAPPATPDEYAITKPENLPEGVTWNEELSKSLAATLHKHGIPKTAVPELLALHAQALTGVQTAVKTSYDEGLAALKAEHGEHYEARREAAGRLAAQVFTDEELDFFDRSGLGNHPKFLSVLMKLGQHAQADSSFIRDASRPGGGMTADTVRGEVAKIMTDKAHPMYEGYWRKDPAVMAHIDALYKKAYGDEKVIIGGVTTEARPGG